MTPEQALARIPGMAGARVVECLADGPTNLTWRVEQGGGQHVLRCDKPAVAELGLDRLNEKRVCATAATAGLTPAYDHFDPVAGICLRAFVPGRSLAAADLRQPQMLPRLAALLRRLHALPASGRAFDPVAAARRYADQLATTEARHLAAQAVEFASRLGQLPPLRKLCHNDLVSLNLLETVAGELLLIDWEYAAVGDPYFDLAVIVRHHELDETLARLLQAAWLQREPTAPERDRLALQCDFYGVLLQLWNLRIAR